MSSSQPRLALAAQIYRNLWGERRGRKKESSMRPSMDGNVRQTLLLSWVSHGSSTRCRESKGPKAGRGRFNVGWYCGWLVSVKIETNRRGWGRTRCITTSTGDCLLLLGQQPRKKKKKRLVMSCRAVVLAYLGYDDSVSRRTLGSSRTRPSGSQAF